MVSKNRTTIVIIVVVVAFAIFIILFILITDRLPRNIIQNVTKNSEWPQAPPTCKFGSATDPQCSDAMNVACTSCVKQTGTGSNTTFTACTGCTNGCTSCSESNCKCSSYKACVPASVSVCRQTQTTSN